MKKLILSSSFKASLIFLFIIQTSHAATYNLNDILKAVAQNNTLSKALEKEGLALEARNMANTASEPIEFFAEGTRAKPIIGESGNEYAIGIGKKFILGSIQNEEQHITRLSNQAYLLDEEKNILSFTNSIRHIYHQHCLDVENYKSFKKSYQEFDKLYKKKQKAFKYQEISKIELLQLEIAKNSLYTQLQEIKMQQDISKMDLLTLSKVTYTPSTMITCQDMYPISNNVQLENTFELTIGAYKKRVESTHKALDRYSSNIESIDMAAQYTEELDMDKYTIGISVPLNFSSSRNEEERAAAMYDNSAISLKHEQTMSVKKSHLLQLKSRLKNSVVTLKSLNSNYQNYRENLLPLIQKSYDLGETSVIEYLLNRQKNYQLKEEIYNIKKEYYSLLFQLYTLTEIRIENE